MESRQRTRILFALTVLGLLSDHRLRAADLQTRVEDFDEPGVSLWTQTERPGGWVEESTRTLEKCKSGRSFRNYQVYFDYNESALSPRSGENCYLHLFVVDPTQSASGTAGTARVWYQKYRLNAEGDFVDRNVDLKLSIEKGGSVERGTLRVVAHQPWPAAVLQPRYPDVMTIDVSTDAIKSEGAPIEFANRSRCCEIVFKGGRVVRWDETLWSKPELTANEPTLQPGGEGAFQEWLSLGLEPKPYKAFWKSFSPFDEKAPHSELLLDVQFQVQGGREARLFQKVRVRFRPPWPLVLLSVALGAVLSSVLSLLIVGLREGGEPLFGIQETTWGKTREILKRLFISVAVAVVIFFAYLLVKGNKAVVLFDFPLEPTQCLPAFLIGLLVGSRPVFYFDLLTSIRKGQDRRAEGAAVLLLALTLFGAAAPLDAQPTVSLRPVDLDYDAAADVLYVLSSPANRIHRLAVQTGALKEVARLSTESKATSECVIRWRDALWLASLSSRPPEYSRFWSVTLALTRIEGGAVPPSASQILRKFTGYGQFHGIDCDGAHQRLLLVDRLREGIYAVPLLPAGLGEPALLVRDSRIKEPVALVSSGSDVFVAVGGRRAVVRVNLETRTVQPVMQDLSEPADLALTPDGSRLLVVDAGQARILELDLRSGAIKERVGSAYLREPRGVQMDRRGHLWVADSWLGAVLEFVPGEDRPVRRVP
jgi:hypothetical protein